MAGAIVLRPRSLGQTDRGGGVRTTYLVTRQVGAAFLNGFTFFDPGSRLALHCHNCEESVVIVEGTAVFESAGTETELNAGDTTWVPAGIFHRFSNNSDEPMKIFWTYSSVDANRTLAATGETFPIGSEMGINH